MEVDVRQEAIAAIEEELARTLADEGNGALVVIEIDPAGDGVMLARSARLDYADQLTGQVTNVFNACEKAGLRPKLIVAGAGISGAKALAERPDLAAVFEALDNEGCAWVAAWDTNRIGRGLFIHQQFLCELYLRGASLYIDCPACVVTNGTPDRLLERMLAVVHHEDRARMVERLRLGREKRRWMLDKSG
jgi:DNA invertase Pin-like site-specific DNA recombinase